MAKESKSGPKSDPPLGERRREPESRDATEHIELLTSAVDAVLWVAEPGPPQRLSFVSDAAQDLLGRSPRQLVGAPDKWLACVHTEDRHRVQASRGYVFSGKTESMEEEYRVVLPAGDVRWVLDKARVYRDETGEPARVYGIVTDLSEHRDAEEERRALDEKLRRKQRLESLGVLAGGVAHEFNNLLLAVIGNAEIGMSLAEGNLEAQRAFEEILAAGQRAAVLSRQMLAYSGRGGLERRRIQIDALVGEMRSILALAAGKNAELEIVCEEELPALFVDPSQLKQVLVNVVTNAGESLGDARGRVRVAVGSRECRGEVLENPHMEAPLPAGRYVVVEVLDDGEGMDRATLGKIFDPFFSTRFPGRGLGLSAVLGILKGHGGGINVESTLGVGTRVEMLLPAPDEASEEREPAPGARRARLLQCPGPVLLVDDEMAIRRVGARMLQRLGLETVSVSSGSEALQTLKAGAHDYCAVIVDTNMPGMTGRQLLGALRRENPGLPVIVCSGFGRRELLVRLGDDMPQHVLHKPFRLAEMEGVLRDALGASRATQRRSE